MKLIPSPIKSTILPAALLACAASAHAALVWQLPLSGGTAGSISNATVLNAAVNDGTHPATNGTVQGSGSSWVSDTDWGTTVWSTVQGNRINAGQQGADRTTGFSWSIWVKLDPTAAGNSDAGADTIMGTRTGTYFKLGLGGAAINSSINSSVGASISFNSGAHTAITSNTWTHISVLGDSSNVRAFVNGVSAGTPDTTVNTSWLTSALEIGGASNFTEDMQGLLRDAAIWDNALTLAQHRGLYTLGAPTSFMYDTVDAQSLYGWADAASLDDTFELNGTTWQLVTDDWALNDGDLQDAGGGLYRFGYNGSQALVTVIPEPSAALLGGLGCLLLLRRRRA